MASRPISGSKCLKTPYLQKQLNFWEFLSSKADAAVFGFSSGINKTSWVSFFKLDSQEKLKTVLIKSVKNLAFDTHDDSPST